MQTAVADIDVARLDYSVFSHADLVNIVLQRSEVLDDIQRPGRLIRAWERGDHAPLDEVVEARGTLLAQRAAQKIRREVQALAPVLAEIAPRRVADIGCGYAMFDLFLYHDFGAELLLIDVEDNEHRHFGYETEAAAYTSLDTARRFLVANGVPDRAITTWNPDEDEIDTDKVDLAVSFLACGFHFPVDMYLPFFRLAVAPGGSVILDLRAGRSEDSRRTLETLGEVQVLAERKGRMRVWLRKGRR